VQKGVREIWKCQNITKFQWRCFIRTGLCWMGFWWSSLWQFPSFFWIIICRRSISILEFFCLVCIYFVVYLAPFQLFCLFVSCCLSYTFSMVFFYMFIFHYEFLWWIKLLLAFCLANKKCKKILMEQNDILWNLQHFIFWKDKINYNKTIMST
jgi:hypothetical protein